VVQVRIWNWTEQWPRERNTDVGSAINNNSNSLLSHLCRREAVPVPYKGSFSSDFEIKCITPQSVFPAPDR